MTEQQAERIANIALGVVAVGAAYYILRTPVLRRAAWQVARTAVAAAGPWLVEEMRRAWAETGIPRPAPVDAPRGGPEL